MVTVYNLGRVTQGIVILGFYSTLEELNLAVPSPNIGDTYGVGEVPYNIYIWDGLAWVDNGTLEGKDGQPGAQGIPGPAGPANTLSIGAVQGGEVADASITGDAPNQTLNLILPKGDPSTVPGPKGDPGQDGADGVSIVSIIRTSGTGAAGTTDTYTITYSDSSTSTFQVYNGADGSGIGDMLASVYADSPGVVKDSAKLGGQLPTYYAKADDIPDISNKVDRVAGKGLSTEDYTTEEKEKLDGLAAVASSGAYSDLNGAPALADIAESGSYNDLSDIPTTFSPSSHAASHKTAGGDALTPGDIGAESAGTAASAVSAHDGSSGAHSTLLGAKLDKSGGTMTGDLTANNPAVADAKVRNISAGTTDLTAGTTTLATGALYFVYE